MERKTEIRNSIDSGIRRGLMNAAILCGALMQGCSDQAHAEPAQTADTAERTKKETGRTCGDEVGARLLKIAVSAVPYIWDLANANPSLDLHFTAWGNVSASRLTIQKSFFNAPGKEPKEYSLKDVRGFEGIKLESVSDCSFRVNLIIPAQNTGPDNPM